jgi:outer membrane protein TolC
MFANANVGAARAVCFPSLSATAATSTELSGYLAIWLSRLVKTGSGS